TRPPNPRTPRIRAGQRKSNARLGGLAPPLPGVDRNPEGKFSRPLLGVYRSPFNSCSGSDCTDRMVGESSVESPGSARAALVNRSSRRPRRGSEPIGWLGAFSRGCTPVDDRVLWLAGGTLRDRASSRLLQPMDS